MELSLDLITFGKFENKSLKEMLRDRKYCGWLLEQDWFKTQYPFLFEKMEKYDPKVFFFPKDTKEEIINNNHEDFLTNYKYFNLIEEDDLTIKLTENEMKCYKFYLDIIQDIKTKFKVRILKKERNPYDIKAPNKWLIAFETQTKLHRDDFKEFLSAYELPNLPIIIEDIRKLGGLEYNGGKSYAIGKKRSGEQELFWEGVLKAKYTNQICTQFKFGPCIFDFINISSNTIYECKLALKDFNEDQFKKYEMTLKKYNIIYLIGRDAVINMDLETIYTNDFKKYLLYQCNIPLLKTSSYFDKIIFEYDIQEVENLTELI